MFSEYTGLPTDTIKGMFNEFGLNGMKPMVETVVDGVREEIIQGNIHFQPIWYREKIDASSQKVRRIGIQNIKQQIYHEYDYKEISEPTGTLDLADVKANPEKYLNYGNEPKRTDTERIDVLEATTDDIILMMADLIGGEA